MNHNDRNSKTTIYLAPHDNHMPPLPSRDCVAIRHPGQGPQSGTRAGIHKEYDYIELLLDSGSRPPAADLSGMTCSANCDIVSKGRGDFCGVKCIGVSRFQSCFGHWILEFEIYL